MFDYIVIGAGITGVMCAHLLKKRGKSVAIIDKKMGFGEASLAAGAFLSPLLGKPNQIKTFLNSSLNYAIDFYTRELPDAIIKNGLIRLPIDTQDLALYESYDYSDIGKRVFTKDSFLFLRKDACEYGAYFFEDAGIVESDVVLNRLANGIDIFIDSNIKELKKKSGYFVLGEIGAKRIILALGASPSIVDTPYLNIRAVCGQRIEIKSDTKIPHNIHKELSISASKSDGRIVVGATHYTCTNCKLTSQAPTKEATLKLLSSADRVIDLKNVEMVSERFGARAASSDYQPILGELIDAQATLLAQPKLTYGAKINMDKTIMHKDVFIINGMGARGFVYAPICAKILVDSIEDEGPIPHFLSVKRRFERWAKKLTDRTQL